MSNGSSLEGRTVVLALAALGIVFGDIGTSPLYALRECFHGEYGIAPTHANLLGVLSLMFWSLVLVVGVKYLMFILRADHDGEGGVFALTSLLRAGGPPGTGSMKVLIAVGVFGGALLYGDGIITPAISVMSAVEGLRIIAPSLKAYVIPVTVLILIGLFLLQRRGTQGIGSLFGPVILVWFLTIGSLGLIEVVQEPRILAAISPVHGAHFLAVNRLHGFLVLGAVFLVVTGAEALYADLGHFGRAPIRLSWFAVTFPALLLNYFGQGALLLRRPEEAHHPFYGLVPAWALVPMIFLATAATIIASQAVISGVFSLTRQAIQMGYCPRLQIIHTSGEQIGQIFVPRANAFLMIATVCLVIGFKDSSRLAAAYGVAVTTTMAITTILFYSVARRRWKWNRIAAGVPAILFLTIDLAFFGANISKILHGAWFPLVVGGVVFTMMVSWKRGRELLAQKMRATALSDEEFIEVLMREPPHRVPGTAVYMTGHEGTVPSALLHNLKHNKVLHEEILLLHIGAEDVPRIARPEKVTVHDLGNGFHRIVARYGFMEEPNVPHILAMTAEKGLDVVLKECSFFLGRERLLPSKRPGMSRWRVRLFNFLSRNALEATSFYHLPVNQVIEIGAQLRL